MNLSRLIFASALLFGAPACAEDIQVNSRIIENFRIGSGETRFGPLEFNGGLELTSANRDFGSLSGLRFTEPGSSLLAVSDNGFWISATIGRDAAGL